MENGVPHPARQPRSAAKDLAERKRHADPPHGGAGLPGTAILPFTRATTASPGGGIRAASERAHLSNHEVNALSVPLFATGRELAGVITVVGSEASFSADPHGEAARVLLAAAREISLRMGGEV